MREQLILLLSNMGNRGNFQIKLFCLFGMVKGGDHGSK